MGSLQSKAKNKKHTFLKASTSLEQNETTTELHANYPNVEIRVVVSKLKDNINGTRLRFLK